MPTMSLRPDGKPKTRLFPVPYYVGDGSGRMFLYVADIAEYPRDADNLCAFCHGDPCAEHSGPESEIVKHMNRCPSYAPFETCPLCLGRPT
jgi:hypothetical protein